MGKLLEQYELVKEIKCNFEGIDPAIVGKIYKVIRGMDAKFVWDINFYCRKSDEASAYIPGNQSGMTQVETEEKLIKYMKRFESEVQLFENT